MRESRRKSGKSRRRGARNECLSLAEYFEAKGENQKDFAARLEVPYKTFEKWAQGLTTPRKYRVRVHIEYLTRGLVHRWISWGIDHERQILTEALTPVVIPRFDPPAVGAPPEGGQAMVKKVWTEDDIDTNPEDLDTYGILIDRFVRFYSAILLNHPEDRTAMQCVAEFTRLAKDLQATMHKMGDREERDDWLDVREPDIVPIYPIRCEGCGKKFVPLQCPHCNHINEELPEHLVAPEEPA